MSSDHANRAHTARRRVRLLHTADVHMEWETNPELVERGFIAAMRAVEETGVDMLVITGDLFDHNKVSDSTIALTLDGLRSVPVPIVILPGNHDAYDENSVYRRVDFEAEVPGLTLVREPNGHLLTFPELTLSIWGRPVVVHEPAFRPISGLPSRSGDNWHVALAHGHFMEKAPTHFSSPIFADQLIDLDWDYVGLGHIHVPRDVSRGQTPVHYSGSPSGSMFSGRLGTVQLVTLDPVTGVGVEAFQLSDEIDSRNFAYAFDDDGMM